MRKEDLPAIQTIGTIQTVVRVTMMIGEGVVIGEGMIKGDMREGDMIESLVSDLEDDNSLSSRHRHSLQTKPIFEGGYDLIDN